MGATRPVPYPLAHLPPPHRRWADTRHAQKRPVCSRRMHMSGPCTRWIEKSASIWIRRWRQGQVWGAVVSWVRSFCVLWSSPQQAAGYSAKEN